MAEKICFSIDFSYGDKPENKKVEFELKEGELNYDFMFNNYFELKNIKDDSVEVILKTLTLDGIKPQKKYTLKLGDVEYYETPTFDAGANYMFYLK